MKQRIPDEAPTMVWIVRWAAELMSKYAVGDDGKTIYERIHHEDCVTPLVPFGGAVMYLPLKTVHRNKGVPATKAGVWLGIGERMEETSIGIEFGVVKCRTVDRLKEEDGWNKHNVLGMIGTPWELVPGRNGQDIPVDVADDGNCMGSDSENEETENKVISDENDEPDFKESIDKFHLSRKAVREFGETAGCAACDIIRVRGDQLGRIGRHHSEECRRRILERLLDANSVVSVSSSSPLSLSLSVVNTSNLLHVLIGRARLVFLNVSNSPAVVVSFSFTSPLSNSIDT